MRIHELTGLKKQEGVIFEIMDMLAKVARYNRPYGIYIEDEILKESVNLEKYMTPREIRASKEPSIKVLVRRAARDICPNEKVVYFEVDSF